MTSSHNGIGLNADGASAGSWSVRDMVCLEHEQIDNTTMRSPVRGRRPTSALPQATQFAFRLAGLPGSCWAFAVRIWIAIVIALCTSFWLQLDAPSSAAATVAILAEPTRGQALEKAAYRLVATIIGVVASIAIVGFLSQARDLILAAFAVWLGLCVYAAGLLDGYRAYAAVLSGYTVGLIAVQQLDSPQLVFESGMARGAAVAVGILSITFVNDLLFAPNRHPQLVAQLAAIHRRVLDYAKAIIRNEPTDPQASTALTCEIVALRPEITSLATEATSGPVRSAAARSATVALVAELHAIHALDALPVAPDPDFGEQLAAVLDRTGEQSASISSVVHAGDDESGLPDGMAASLAWALEGLLRRDEEVRQNLAALKSGTRPPRSWRAPLYRSHRMAIDSALRSAAHFGIASVVLVFGGWPATSALLSLVAVVIGLGATTPGARKFTVMASVAAPIAVALAGLLEFWILDGVSDFPLLAIGLAPFTIGAALLIASANPALSDLGRLNLVFMTVVFVPSNPQAYNPQAFLFLSFFLCLATGLLVTAQVLIPRASDDRRRRWLIASARHELGLVLSRSDRRYPPEDAMFRDAARLGQIAAAGPTDLQQRMAVEEALSYFDQAAAIRLCDAKLTRLADGPLAGLAAEARRALVDRDALRIRASARSLREAALGDACIATATSAALFLAAAVIEAAPVQAANAPTENGS
jgi:uncharacterized membrane protein YccC